MESDHIEEFLPDGFLASKGERCAPTAFRAGPGIPFQELGIGDWGLGPRHNENDLSQSAIRAGPGIHTLPRVEVHVHVRPGIQVQAKFVEPPPAYNRYELIGGPKAVREVHYIRLVRAANHILPFPLTTFYYRSLTAASLPNSKTSLTVTVYPVILFLSKKHGKAG